MDAEEHDQARSAAIKEAFVQRLEALREMVARFRHYDSLRKAGTPGVCDDDVKWQRYKRQMDEAQKLIKDIEYLEED